MDPERKSSSINDAGCITFSEIMTIRKSHANGGQSIEDYSLKSLVLDENLSFIESDVKGIVLIEKHVPCNVHKNNEYCTIPDSIYVFKHKMEKSFKIS